MVYSLESLEEKFKQVERASERRILDRPELSQSELVDSTAMKTRFYHKKPTVSISQFGKLEEREEICPRSLAPSPLSASASRSSFYHSLGSPRSFDSFLSNYHDQETGHSEEQREIQVERISGRQTLPKTVGALLPRRLTGATPPLDSVNMVIDVSVETTTESSHSPLELQRSTAYATRPRSSTMDTSTSQSSLVERAKDFARKLRRKSKPELS